jgi:hypothetical protein
MKIKNLLVGLGMIVFWYVNTALNSSGPPPGMTGAPNEKTCSTAAGCHTGGTFTGTISIEGVPSKVEAGKSYTLLLSCTSAAKSSGFELTCLDGTGAKAGDFTPGVGTSGIVNAGKQYVRQSSPQNYQAGKVSWTTVWTAPVTATNKDFTFYTAVNLCNSNGTKAGDNAIVSTKVATFTTSPTNDLALEKTITMFPIPASNQLNVNMLDAKDAIFTLTNLEGRTFLKTNMQDNNSFDVSDLARGIYFAKIQVGEKQVVKKIILQ